MAYGSIKVDNIIYTKGGSDTTITVSGIVDSLSGAISVTGSISGASVSAATGTFTTLSGNTTAGTTATFVTGVFTTTLSGATITGDAGQFSNITGVSGVFTTRISGATITGNTGQFTSITGGSGVFTSFSGTTVTATTGVFASGTAAAPSISVGTTTNGLYSSAANEVAVATSGNSRLVVDASGNVNIDAGTFYVDAVNNRVGIGTTGPANPLHVVGTSRFNVSGSNNVVFGADSGDPYIYAEQNTALKLGTNSALRLTLDASGNLGLGVTPSAWQSIYRAEQFPAGVSIAGRNDGGIEGVFATNAFRDSAGTWTYVNNGVARRYVQEADGHLWYTAPAPTAPAGAGSAITFTQAMTLDASGNLVIGSTNASPARLDVTSSSSKIASFTPGTSTSAMYMALFNDGSHRSIIGNDNSTGNGLWGTGGSAYALSIGTLDSYPIVLGTANTERVRITSGGLVGIGTTGPTFKLDVKMSGSARTDGLVIRRSDNDNHQLGLWTAGGIMYFDAVTDNPSAAGQTIFRRSLDSGSTFNESARFDASGRLLVGDTSDSGGALLQVNGDRIRVGTAKTPASASATGTTGEVCWDANYIYVCTATNTWKRSALSTW